MGRDPFVFETRERDHAGRIGRLATPHGVVETPALLPVLNPNIPLLSPLDLRRVGASMVITNSYVVRRNPDLREKALREGIHSVLGWEGPVMTDSGTFQSYVYGDLPDVDPLEIVEFQREIGSDVGTILDVFSPPDRTRKEAEKDLEETHRRAKQASKVKGSMALAVTVQGSVFPDLRARAARNFREDEEIRADLYPIGGVVPLLESQRYEELAEIVVAAQKELDPTKPVHLFGAGHPMVFSLAALLGCDLFDSASYAKYAKGGRLLFEDGTRLVSDLKELACVCPTCQTHTVQELRTLPQPQREKALALHNLAVSLAEIRRVREAIREGTLRDLVERRARSHPHLFRALRVLRREKEWFERLDPLSKRSAFFGFGDESIDRPEVVRARKRLEPFLRPTGRPRLLLKSASRPFSRTYAPLLSKLDLDRIDVFVATLFGPVPIELDETYPFAQSIVDPTVEERAFVTVGDAEPGFVRDSPHARKLFLGGGLSESEALLRKVRSIADYQFGEGAGRALFEGHQVEIQKSSRTGKIRTVRIDGIHALSLRAEDGLFTLKIEGGILLQRGLPPPRMRVVVEPTTAEFPRKGLSVFGKFVRSVDSHLRVGDECLVVDPSDELLAVGELQRPPSDLSFHPPGVVVRVREGAESLLSEGSLSPRGA